MSFKVKSVRINAIAGERMSVTYFPESDNFEPFTMHTLIIPHNYLTDLANKKISEEEFRTKLYDLIKVCSSLAVDAWKRSLLTLDEGVIGALTQNEITFNALNDVVELVDE